MFVSCARMQKGWLYFSRFASSRGERFWESLMRKLIVLLALSSALTACGSSQLGGAGSLSDIKVVESDVLPEPTRLDLFEQNRPYLIGPFDKLTIDVFGIEELSKQEEIRSRVKEIRPLMSKRSNTTVPRLEIPERRIQ